MIISLALRPFPRLAEGTGTMRCASSFEVTSRWPLSASGPPLAKSDRSRLWERAGGAGRDRPESRMPGRLAARRAWRAAEGGPP